MTLTKRSKLEREIAREIKLATHSQGTRAEYHISRYMHLDRKYTNLTRHHYHDLRRASAQAVRHVRD